MTIIEGTKRARLAELYHLSGSFRTDGPFEFSAHKDNPHLEKSPQKLRLPEAGDPGLIYLPEISALTADLFLDLLQELGVQPDCFSGVPAGIEPVASAFERLVKGRVRRLRFAKIERNGRSDFVGPVDGFIRFGDLVLAFDDHTSGGRNKKLFMEAVSSAGGTVGWFFTIVDRGQGAEAFMKEAGVVYRWIFTLEELLDYYLRKGYISLEVASDIRGYVARNQIGQQA